MSLWCLDGESTFTSNSSPCSPFFIPLLNLLIKSTCLWLCKSFLKCLHRWIDWNCQLPPSPLVHIFIQTNSQVVQCCDSHITLQITWLLVYLCYNHASIHLHFSDVITFTLFRWHFSDVILFRGYCCCLSIHPSQEKISGGGMNINTTSSWNGFYVTPSSFFVRTPLKLL